MALTLDIKPNDELANSANRTAKALERVAALENRINGLSKRNAVTVKVAAAAVERAQEKNKTAVARENKLKQIALDEEKKRAKTLKEVQSKVKGIATATAAAVVSATALAFALGASGKNAFESRKEAGALLNAFTGRRGPQAMKLLDTMAGKLGETFGETRAKFVEFRQAGLNNRQSFQLIKLRSDLKAVGLSAGEADKEISRVTSLADGVGNVAALRMMRELSRVYGGVGSGAKAASLAMISLEGAQNKVNNAVSTVLADMWKEVGPSIGRATHRLADFAVNLLKSDEGKAVIRDTVDLFKRMADAVNDENLTTGLNAIRASAVAIATPFDLAGKAIGFLASGIKNAVDMTELSLTALTGGSAGAGAKAIEQGKAIAAGYAKGMRAHSQDISKASDSLARDASVPFAEKLGIHSPSKLFEQYGRNTVEGYAQGERKAIASESGAMPLQEVAAKPVQNESKKSGSSSSPSQSLTFNITVNAESGDGEDIAEVVKAQIQRMFTLGNLSRGIT